MLMAVAIGASVGLMLAIFVVFLFLTTRHQTAQDISDRQDKEWKRKHQSQ